MAWRERECRKEGDAIYLFNGYTRERKKRRKRVYLKRKALKNK